LQRHIQHLLLALVLVRVVVLLRSLLHIIVQRVC
jgi:hypothetical protein